MLSLHQFTYLKNNFTIGLQWCYLNERIVNLSKKTHLHLFYLISSRCLDWKENNHLTFTGSLKQRWKKVWLKPELPSALFHKVNHFLEF